MLLNQLYIIDSRVGDVGISEAISRALWIIHQPHGRKDNGIVAGGSSCYYPLKGP
jgi:hypothetical protein